MTCSEPEDEDEDEDEAQTEVDDGVENVDEPENYEFNWPLLRKLFFQNTRQLQLFAIDFSPTSPVDFVQLKIPKHDRTKFLWTASFFVKEASEWYVYRKVLVLSRDVTPAELPELYKKLERSAYVQLQFMRRRKQHLLEYLEIVL